VLAFAGVVTAMAQRLETSTPTNTVTIARTGRDTGKSPLIRQIAGLAMDRRRVFITFW
jgi:hypothetical protein